MKTQLQPLKGFRDYYPQDKALLEYIFATFKAVADIYGFEQYDGPIVEPLDLYVNKSSEELLNEQSFNLTDRDGRKLLLRPEMTPSLARMVAARSMELPFPIRWTNIGRRFRYEAPQKGRSREFYQMDCDILGSSSPVADCEILSVAIDFFKSLGASKDEFEVRINSREVLKKALLDVSVPEKLIKDVISTIDRREKISAEAFDTKLAGLGLDKKIIIHINELLSDTDGYKKNFEEFLSFLPQDLLEFIVVDPCIVRGLDYYTGIVFEVKAKKGLTRSLLGGGRYDNLVERYDDKRKVAGIGFATSNVVIEEFLKDNDLLPELVSLPTEVLVTVFNQELAEKSFSVAKGLRDLGISTEVYPETTVPLKKQFEYANKRGISYIAIIGPDEAKDTVITLKDLNSGTQETLSSEDLFDKLLSV